MAGETPSRGAATRWHGPATAQPGGRAPAPGDLALVQSFINTHYDLEVDHGAEVLYSVSALTRWLRSHGLECRDASAADLELAIQLREGLRELARSGGDPQDRYSRLNRAAAGAPVELRFGADGPGFVPVAHAGAAGAFGLILAIAARAMIDGTWSRLKICPGDDCDWAFYDHSRNQTGRWCSMSICGSRAKARAHYRRTRARGA